MANTLLMRFTGSWTSTLTPLLRKSLQKHTTKRVVLSTVHRGQKDVSSFTLFKMSRLALHPLKTTWGTLNSGFRSTNWEGLSTGSSLPQELSYSSLLSEDSHSCVALLSRWCQWRTFYAGVTCGDTKTGGADAKKWSWLTRSWLAQDTSSPWSEQSLRIHNI